MPTTFNRGNATSPCKDCRKRKPYCHETCRKYQKFKESGKKPKRG